jgi:hypothetical protein
LHVKIFISTILILVAVTISGFATWLFPIVNNIHEQLGGQPLPDPRGSIGDQINTWLGFLPSDSIERTQIICYLIAAYLVVTSGITLLAVHLAGARSERAARSDARARTLRFVYKPTKPVWRPAPISNEYTRGEPDGSVEAKGKP